MTIYPQILLKTLNGSSPKCVGKRANINTFQIITVRDGNALVIVEDTSIYETNDYGMNWEKVRDDYPKLYGALVIPEGCRIT